MSLSVLTAVGLVTSANALPAAESTVIIVAQTDIANIGIANRALASGTSLSVSSAQTPPPVSTRVASETGTQKWYATVPLNEVNHDSFLISNTYAPNLPTYLASPTTANARLTSNSKLMPLQHAGLTSSVETQTDPTADDDVIVVTGPDRASPIDPLADVNAEAFQLGQDFDRAIMAPIAKAYKDTLPKPARSGIRNLLNNLGEPIVFLNYLLQLKPGKAMETLGRFAINSTVGIAGLIDVAKDEPFNLPHRKNGFANTLGYYGIDSGSYLYLPIIGATSVRDLIGDGLDLMVLPTAIGKPFNKAIYTAPAGVLRALDRRIELDDQIREIQDESADPYVAQREFYLKTRQMEIDILKGIVPDPLSRKNSKSAQEESSLKSKFKHEVAYLWYLPAEGRVQ